IYNGSRHPVAEAIDKSYADGNWHLAVGTIANDGEKLYLDGVLKGTNSNNYAQSGGEVYAVIGGNNLAGWGSPADTDQVPTNFYYTGTLDDPIIYNGTELNATQV